MPAVLITGAAGLLGRILRQGLGDAYDVRGLDRRRSEGVLRADMARGRGLARAFDGVDAVIDLAGVPDVETAWSDVYANNIPATINALEAARAAGARRFVYASSNHVTGLYERDDPYARIVAGDVDGLDPAEIPLIRAGDPLRPDSPYALGKSLGEAAGRFYAEEHGLSVVCLRIGTVNEEDRPLNARHLATLLTHRDLVSLVDHALRAPAELVYAVYYGVSANTWRFWDVENAKEIGWSPVDDAEHFRAEATVG